MSRFGWRFFWVAAAAIPAAFLAVFFVWPTLALVGRGFTADAHFSLDGFRSVFSSARTWRAVGFTLASATASTLLCLVLGLPGAYLLYRCAFPGRGLLRAAVTIPFVLPTVVVGVAFGSLLREDGLLGALRLSGTPVAIVAAMVFFNYSVVVRTVGTMWARLDPRLAQAGATLGASPARVLMTVTLPALAPAVLSAASLVFLFSSSSYGIVMVLGQTRYQNIESQIWFLTTQLLDLRGAAALSITQLVIVAAVLWMGGGAQQRLTRALTLQPDVAASRRLSLPRDTAALTVTLATAVVLSGLPLANLGWRSFHRGGVLSVVNYAELASVGGLGVSVWDATATTLLTALLATAFAVPLGILAVLAGIVMAVAERMRPEEVATW